jgi:hypothetical protein
MLLIQYRTQFIRDHDPLPDDEFIRALNISELQIPIALSLRRALAKTCKIPAECIYPNEPLTEIGRLILGDEFDLVTEVEKDLAIAVLRSDDIPALFDLQVFGMGEKEFQFIAAWFAPACEWIATNRTDCRFNAEEIASRLDDLLHRADGLSGEQLNEIKELIKNNEPSIAFENLCSLLEHQSSLPPDFLDELAQLGKIMEIHPSYWQNLYKI